VSEQAASLETSGPADAAALAERVVANLGSALHATRETLRLPLLCLLAEGHVLVEDVPGVGKTVLAKALARSVEACVEVLAGRNEPLPTGAGHRVDDAHQLRVGNAARQVGRVQPPDAPEPHHDEARPHRFA